MAAVSPIGRAAGLEPLGVGADASGAGALYQHHSRQVFAYCLSRLGRREDAEDAVQTTFLHAVRALRRGVVPTVELAWLLGIARNVCLSRHASAGRRGRLELVCDPVDLERTAARQSRSDELIGLEDALARLPEQQRRAVLLRDWRGLSYEEVAAHLDVSLANAQTLIFRGRRSLAALLQEQPSATRRRLGSLTNLGSVLTAVKTAFTGATSAAKIAAAITVVAASGAGIVAGTSALAETDRSPARPPVASTPKRHVPTPDSRPVSAPAAPSAHSAPAVARPTAPPRPLAPIRPSVPVAPVTPARAPAPAPTASAPAAPTAPTDAPAAGTAPPLPDVVAAPPLPDVATALPLPPPVETPAVVETVVEALPAVTVTTPVVPVTVDPGTLLP